VNWVCPKCAGPIDRNLAQCVRCGYVPPSLSLTSDSKLRLLAARALTRDVPRFQKRGYQLKVASVEWSPLSDRTNSENLGAEWLFGMAGGHFFHHLANPGGTLQATFLLNGATDVEPGAESAGELTWTATE